MKWNRLLSVLLLLAMTAALLAGCAQSDTVGLGQQTSKTNAGKLQQLTQEMESSAKGEDYGRQQAQAVTSFGLELLQQVYQEEKDNTLLSPLSAAYALGMTAAGAQGETLAQMEQLLGGPVDQLSQGLGGYLVQVQGEDQLKLANSLWVNQRDSFHPNQEFLENAAGQYQAQVFQGPFDEKTLKQLNRWVNQKTNKKIPSILDRLDPQYVMVLLNALYFEASWAEPYRKPQIREEFFTTEAGQQQQVQMMHSGESLYWQLEGGQGFLKLYQGDNYAFAALLPSEGESMAEFLPRLTGEGLFQALEEAREEEILAAIPQFKFQGSYDLKDSLKEMGMIDAFLPGAADFSKLGVSENGPIYVDLVRQKTYIEVDDQGTKAAAATAIAVSSGAAPIQREIYQIYLDRPFLYLLLDRRTNTPLMMGVAMEINE